MKRNQFPLTHQESTKKKEVRTCTAESSPAAFPQRSRVLLSGRWRDRVRVCPSKASTIPRPMHTCRPEGTSSPQILMRHLSNRRDFVSDVAKRTSTAIDYAPHEPVWKDVEEGITLSNVMGAMKNEAVGVSKTLTDQGGMIYVFFPHNINAEQYTYTLRVWIWGLGCIRMQRFRARLRC